MNYWCQGLTKSGQCGIYTIKGQFSFESTYKKGDNGDCQLAVDQSPVLVTIITISRLKKLSIVEYWSFV